MNLKFVVTSRICFLLFATVIFITVATSCVKDVILDAMEEPTVVVDCILTDEPTQTLHLVYTKGASRAEAPDLPEATAVLTDLTEGKEAGRFARTADGSWTLIYAAIPSHRYRLDVTVPGHEPIWAEQTMPEPPGVEVGWHSWNPAWDPVLEQNDNTVGYCFQFHDVEDPVWFYGVDYPTLESPGERTQYLCTNSQAVDPFTVTEGWGFKEERNGNYLWGDKVKSVFRTSTYPILEDAPLHKRYLRFPAVEDAPDTTFFVSGSFQGYISDTRDFLHAELRPAELHWFSASEDYDRFLQDSYHLIDLKNSTDLADIFVRDNVYGNIHGAIGLFGAKIDRMVEWDGRNTWQASGYFLLASFVSNHVEIPYSDTDDGSGHPINKTVLESRPFDLLHFEYWHLPDEEQVPAWVPERKGPSNVNRFYLKVIENQVQLDSEGLGDCGVVDFTKKKVLVLAIGDYAIIPVLVGYGLPGNTGLAGIYWPEDQYVPVLLFDKRIKYTDFTPLRIAIAVDKEDAIASHMDMYVQFCSPINLNIFQVELSDGIAWTY